MAIVDRRSTYTAMILCNLIIANDSKFIVNTIDGRIGDVTAYLTSASIISKLQVWAISSVIMLEPRQTALVVSSLALLMAAKSSYVRMITTFFKSIPVIGVLEILTRSYGKYASFEIKIIRPAYPCWRKVSTHIPPAGPPPTTTYVLGSFISRLTISLMRLIKPTSLRLRCVMTRYEYLENLCNDLDRMQRAIKDAEKVITLMKEEIALKKLEKAEAKIRVLLHCIEAEKS
ncbi:hypothetical protein GQX74_010562 [Glossina fuscipes]|nr:hypothetical protein GQX74_010562 [Glossina fuscipes]